MKPHEETLVVWDKQQSIRIMREDGAGDPLLQYTLAMVYEAGPNDDPEVKTYQQGHALALARATLFATAPEMARALLALGGLRRVTAMDEWHLTPCVRRHAGESCDEECEAVRAVLTKAGVLP